MTARRRARARAKLTRSYRRWRARLDNPPVRHARELAARLRSDPPAVLHLGASDSLYRDPQDTDIRLLPELLFDRLPAGTSAYTVRGPGYHPSLFSGYLRMVEATPVRPVVVVGIAVRLGLMPWSDHPFYGYRRSVDLIRSLDPAGPLWRMRRTLWEPTQADMDEYDERSWTTLVGTRRIGDYRGPLKDPARFGLEGDELGRLYHSYHHGAVLAKDDPWFDSVVALGRQLKEMGVGVVPYHLPLPMQAGVDFLGEEFTELVWGNIERLEAAFAEGFGPIDFVRRGLTLESSDFIDPNDGLEHMKLSGRLKMVDALEPRVQDLLANR